MSQEFRVVCRGVVNPITRSRPFNGKKYFWRWLISSAEIFYSENGRNLEISEWRFPPECLIKMLWKEYLRCWENSSFSSEPNVTRDWKITWLKLTITSLVIYIVLKHENYNLVTFLYQAVKLFLTSLLILNELLHLPPASISKQREKRRIRIS